MAERGETPMDQEVYERVLKEELDKGSDKRIAEGKARRAGVIAHRKAHGEPEAAPAAGVATATIGAPAAAVRVAPPPTGKPPTAAKPGQAEKHRLLALVPPE